MLLTLVGFGESISAEVGGVVRRIQRDGFSLVDKEDMRLTLTQARLVYDEDATNHLDEFRLFSRREAVGGGTAFHYTNGHALSICSREFKRLHPSIVVSVVFNLRLGHSIPPGPQG